MKKSFLDQFKHLKKTAGDHFELVGDVLLVETLPCKAPEKEIRRNDGSVARLTLSAGDKRQVDGLEMNLPTFCRVLAVGEGFYEEDKDGNMTEIPLSVEPGDIILVGPMAIKRLSAFGPLISTTDKQIAITRESEVQLRFKGQGGYEACFKALKESIDPVERREEVADFDPA